MRWITPKHFAALAFTVAGPFGLQAQQPSPSAPKSERTATVAGVIFPGGGQYYAGATRKGFVFTGLAAASFLVGKAMSSDAEYRTTTTGKTLIAPDDQTPFVAGCVVGGVVWLIGAVQAPTDARHANQRPPRVSLISTPRTLGLSVGF
jgi:hypothetical protein